MDSREPTSPDRLEQVARALLGLALMASVAWAWAGNGI